MENEITKIPVHQMSDAQVKFARDVAALAEKHGVDRFELSLKPGFNYGCYVTGDIVIAYYAVDGRGRPCRNLHISCNANIRHVIEANPESSS